MWVWLSEPLACSYGRRVTSSPPGLLLSCSYSTYGTVTLWFADLAEDQLAASPSRWVSVRKVPSSQPGKQ